MAPVKIKHVVSFTSQDPKYPVDNLLLEGGPRPWLSCPRDRNRLLKVELQLEQASHIGYIDIGNCGTAFLQIEVGRSSWPVDRSYLTLLPTTTLMIPTDARLDKNRSGVRMFKEGDFLAEALGEKWDRIRLTCSQPFNKHSPFGLSFVRIRTPLDDGPGKADPPSSPAQASSEPTRLSSAAFCKTFLQEVPSDTAEEAELKSRLQQLDPGTRSPDCLSRPARMVLKAAVARKRTFPLAGGSTLPATQSKEQARLAEDGAQSRAESWSRQESSVRRDRTKTRRKRGSCQKAGRSVASCSVGPRHGSRREERGRGQKGRRRRTEGGKEMNEKEADGPEEAEVRVGTCPICAGRFPTDLLPAHASDCGEDAFEASPPSSPSSWEEPSEAGVCCPICQSHFPAAEVEVHASSCGEPPATSPSWLRVAQGE